MLQDVDESGNEQIEHIALAIKRITQNQNHCGILYRDGKDAVWFLHLAWNFDLRVETPIKNYQWIPISLNKSNGKFLSVICDRIRTANPAIPYGLDSTGIKINQETGNVSLGETGKGLTCASFIMTILKSYSLKLLEEDQWPENANTQWQNSIITSLENTKSVSPEHLEAIRKDIGNRRFSPEEVVAASSHTPWPVEFATAKSLSETLLLHLH